MPGVDKIVNGFTKLKNTITGALAVFGKEGKLAVISDVASRLRRQMSDKIKGDIAYNENLLKAGIDVEDLLKRYKALPDLKDFVNPLEAITEEGEPERIRIKVE